MVDSRCVVSDCSTNPSQCHVNAQCVSTGEGGYRCVCTEGYNGDGIRQCVEDHIGCNVLNNCGRNAVCGYNQTSANFVCVCQQVCLLNPQIRPRYYRFLADHPLDRRFFSFQSGRERRSSKSTEREEWKSGRGELDDVQKEEGILGNFRATTATVSRACRNPRADTTPRSVRLTRHASRLGRINSPACVTKASPGMGPTANRGPNTRPTSCW